MLSKKTVFIVGAGAHFPHGFPFKDFGKRTVSFTEDGRSIWIDGTAKGLTEAARIDLQQRLFGYHLHNDKGYHTDNQIPGNSGWGCLEFCRTAAIF